MTEDVETNSDNESSIDLQLCQSL